MNERKSPSELIFQSSRESSQKAEFNVRVKNVPNWLGGARLQYAAAYYFEIFEASYYHYYIQSEILLNSDQERCRNRIQSRDQMNNLN